MDDLGKKSDVPKLNQFKTILVELPTTITSQLTPPALFVLVAYITGEVLICFSIFLAYFFVICIPTLLFSLSENDIILRKIQVVYQIMYVIVFTACIFGKKVLDNVVLQSFSGNSEGTILTDTCIFLVSFIITVNTLSIIKIILELIFEKKEK